MVGVIQMINKISFDGQLDAFEEQDVEVMELFAKLKRGGCRTGCFTPGWVSGDGWGWMEMDGTIIVI